MDKSDAQFFGIIILLAGFLLGTTGWMFHTLGLANAVAAGWFQAIASVIAIAWAAWLPTRYARKQEEKAGSALVRGLISECSQITISRINAIQYLKSKVGQKFTPQDFNLIYFRISEETSTPTPQYSIAIQRPELLEPTAQVALATFYLAHRQVGQSARIVIESISNNLDVPIEPRRLRGLESQAIYSVWHCFEIQRILGLDEVMALRNSASLLSMLYPNCDLSDEVKLREVLASIREKRCVPDWVQG